MSAPRPALSQILLHISPPPLNIRETRDVYQALKQYGEIELFKVVRHINTTNLPAPTAHVIFSSTPRTLPRSFIITTSAPPPRPVSMLGHPPTPFFPRQLTLTPLPSNFAHHDHVKKVFRTVAGDGIRGLRATLDVAEDAETEQEEALMAAKQNLTSKQLEEEPGQYGRLLRLYAGSFRGFESLTTSPSDSNSKDKEIDSSLEKSQGNSLGEGPQEQEQEQGWLQALAGWDPVKRRTVKVPQPPKGLNTKRGVHTAPYLELAPSK